MTAEQNQSIRTALKTSLYPGAADESVDMVLAYCRASGLDPLTKPVHIVPLWIPEKRVNNVIVAQAGMRDVIMPGIELYRIKAHRTGEYAGQDEAVFGETIQERLGGVEMRYPLWCRVAVYRMVAGQRVRFPTTVYWLECYAKAKKDTDTPNSMWLKRPFGQLEKCAEALALRKAFPEAVGAQPTAEEMDIEPPLIEGPSVPVPPTPLLMPAVKDMPYYPEDRFNENLPKWRGAIESGRYTPEHIIAMVQSKGPLTPPQVTTLRTCGTSSYAPPAERVITNSDAPSPQAITTTHMDASP